MPRRISTTRSSTTGSVATTIEVVSYTVVWQAGQLCRIAVPWLAGRATSGVAQLPQYRALIDLRHPEQNASHSARAISRGRTRRRQCGAGGHSIPPLPAPAHWPLRHSVAARGTSARGISWIDMYYLSDPINISRFRAQPRPELLATRE